MPSDRITVIIPTCPRPSHPSTAILDETIASVRKELPKSHIIIAADGPKAEVDAFAVGRYNAFCHNIEGRYDNTQVIKFEQRGHQTGNLEAILPSITTPLIFYCEDDWRILPGVEWKELSDLVLATEFNYVKLYPAPRVSPYHEHMMRERVSFNDNTTHLIRTVQFSCNPHLASTEWYREMFRRHLSNKVEFIEEVLHGIIGQAPWEEYKLGIYNPGYGDMYRCIHLDGKKG